MEINWEQRRYELAKAAMQGILSNPERISYQMNKTELIVKSALRYTDEMIKQIRKDEL